MLLVVNYRAKVLTRIRDRVYVLPYNAYINIQKECSIVVVVCGARDSVGSTNVRVFTSKCYPKDVGSRQPVGSTSLIGGLVTIFRPIQPDRPKSRPQHSNQGLSVPS